eukprot:m.35122 g.35122  ORF g.35122 m.35122 type:complete len:497 (-) comp12745_c0_seq2:642-2132(-)
METRHPKIVTEVGPLDTVAAEQAFEVTHVQRSVPAIIRGACTHWPACRWSTGHDSAEGLRRPAVADRQVSVLVVPTAAKHSDAAHSGGTPTVPDQVGVDDGSRTTSTRSDPPPTTTAFTGCPDDRDSVILDFSTVLDMAYHAATAHHGMMDSAPGPLADTNLSFYLSQCPIVVRTASATADAATDDAAAGAVLPELIDDIRVPEYLCRKMTECNLWVGTGAARTNPHFDTSHNILYVILGRKRVLLSPPAHGPRYAFHPTWQSASFYHAEDSLIDSGERGSDGGGLASATTAAMTVEVNAGDGLYIPEGWIHTVESDPGTVAVNVWWPGAAAKLQAYVTAQAPDTGLELYLCRCMLALAIKTARDRRRDGASRIEPNPTDAADPEHFAALSHQDREAQLGRMPFAVQQRLLPVFATKHPADWAQLCATMRPTTASTLLDGWENAAAAAEFYASVFDDPLGEELAAQTKHALLAARNEVGREAVPSVLPHLGLPGFF